MTVRCVFVMDSKLGCQHTKAPLGFAISPFISLMYDMRDKSSSSSSMKEARPTS